MPYTLWSRGRLLGHTDLDIPCVQSSIRQGFIEPTEEGRRVLPDATGVVAVSCRLARLRKESGRARSDADLTEFHEACARREALDLELRDESGAVFPADWIQVNDIRALETMDLADDEDDEPLDPQLEADIQHDLELLETEWEDRPWEDSDVRWETMQYHMMVYLPGTIGVRS